MRSPDTLAPILLAILLSSLSGTAAAQDRSPRTLRPTGPVTINADRAEWEKGGAMVYTGHVRLESGALKLTGERLQLTQHGNGQFEARVSGSQATLDHAGGPSENGEAVEPVSARAAILTYDSRSEIVEVDGDAVLTRGTGNKITGQKIRYDVARRKIEADGGTGQVTIVIDQPPREDSGAPKPEPVPGAAAPKKP